MTKKKSSREMFDCSSALPPPFYPPLPSPLTVTYPPYPTGEPAVAVVAEETRPVREVVRPRLAPPTLPLRLRVPPVPSTFSRSFPERQNHESSSGSRAESILNAACNCELLTRIPARMAEEKVPESARNTDNNKPEKCSQRAVAPELTPSLSETGALRVGEGGNSRR